MSQNPRRLLPLFLGVALALHGCGDKGEGAHAGDDSGVVGDGGGDGETTDDRDDDGFTTADGDCNDQDPTVYPGAADPYGDGSDQNCDGTDGVDSDGDGWASAAGGGPDCDDEDPGLGDVGADADCDGVLSADDCDDTDPTSTAIADDSDCDGVVAADDCDDAEAAVHPGASEICNGVDDDCDGAVDDDDTTLDISTATSFYADADSDGYGDPADEVVACLMPSGRVTDDTDCDDTDGSIHPAASEVCNEVDDDCDGDVDDDDASLDTTTGAAFHADADSDGYGDAASATLACVAPSGTVTDGTDCDDTDSSVHPGASEVCGDGTDNDCSGTVDDGCPIDAQADAASFFDGGAVGDELGGSLVASSDLNGDGFDDLVLGAWGDDTPGTNVGLAYIVYGSTTLPTGDITTVYDHYLQGVSFNDRGGQYLGGLPDLDGDGYDEVLFAIPGHDGGGSGAGAVALVYGPAASGTLPGNALIQGSAGDWVGYYQKGAVGDVSNDGSPDFAVSAYATDTNGTDSGTVYIFDTALSGTVSASTSASASIRGVADYDYVGQGGVSAGDLTGDGIDDLLVGRHTNNDAWIFEGPVVGSMDIDTGDVLISDSSGLAELLGSRTLVGDFDGDGHADAAVAAGYYYGYRTQGGAWYILSGPITAAQDVDVDAAAIIEGTFNGLGLYSNGAVSADLDSDGTDDLVVGCNSADEAYGFYGPISGGYLDNDADVLIEFTSASAQFGLGLDVGDVNGDGDLDIVVGGPAFRSRQGSAGVYLGPSFR